jgi:ABC-type lipoprotein export system ATPase subunit
VTQSGYGAHAVPQSPADAPVVFTRHMTRTFGAAGAQVVAVRDATCVLQWGTQVALTGPSGSGKSTLLHLMAGLDTPTSGSLRWPALGGHPLAAPGQMGIVLQGPSLIPSLDVTENVLLPMLFGEWAESAATERACAALARLEIDDLADKLPQELSGGQAQRVAVARALAPGPKLILADEPTGQLDHSIGAKLIDVLLRASEESGAALVVSTHHPLIARRLPREWTMRDGHLDVDIACVATERS